MMKTSVRILLFSMFLAPSGGCQKCLTCTKTIGGVAGNFVAETRQECDYSEARTLEDSSSGTTVWSCD